MNNYNLKGVPAILDEVARTLMKEGHSEFEAYQEAGRFLKEKIDSGPGVYKFHTKTAEFEIEVRPA